MKKLILLFVFMILCVMANAQTYCDSLGYYIRIPGVDKSQNNKTDIKLPQSQLANFKALYTTNSNLKIVSFDFSMNATGSDFMFTNKGNVFSDNMYTYMTKALKGTRLYFDNFIIENNLSKIRLTCPGGKGITVTVF